ncbi:hypothetical protein DFH09DRAFT_1335158 [Mycena vulgaris]|nr:hypothetical protein DFH09DRAFT_1335158 [Mycena vulgaris]
MEEEGNLPDATALDPAAWIALGRVYREVPTAVASARLAARALPTSLTSRLPMPDMPVAEFLAMSLPRVLDIDAPFTRRPSLWFSSDPPNFGEDAVLFLPSIPPLDFVRKLESDLSQSWLNGARSIIDHTDNTRRLPLWAPTFFRKITTFRTAQTK